MTDAPSCFLPNTHKQFAWDSTSLKIFKECPRKYQYKMLEGWAGARNMHLIFGGEFAHAIETFIKLTTRGEAREDVLLFIVHEVLKRTWDHETNEPWRTGDDYKNRFTLLRTIVAYIDNWEDDPTQVYLLQDGSPAVELSFRFELHDGIILCGHLDRVVHFNSNLYVMDQKTSKSTLAPHYFKQFKNDIQMSLYSLAGKIVLDSPIAGVLIDAVQITKDGNAFGRGIAPRTDAHMEEFLFDLEHTIAQAHKCDEEDHWPMNQTACNNFGGCEFLDVCSSSPRIRPALLKSNFTQRFWNPLETR